MGDGGAQWLGKMASWSAFPLLLCRRSALDEQEAEWDSAKLSAGSWREAEGGRNGPGCLEAGRDGWHLGPWH